MNNAFIDTSLLTVIKGLVLEIENACVETFEHDEIVHFMRDLLRC